MACNFLVEQLQGGPTLEFNYPSAGKALLRFSAQETGWPQASCDTKEHLWLQYVAVLRVVR